MSNSPTRSPFIRADRNFRSFSVPSNNHADLTSNPSSNNIVRKSPLLSQNQFHQISENLTNLRHSTVPTIDTSTFDDQEIYASSPDSINLPTEDKDEQDSQVIGNYTVQIQEYAIMEDLLYVLAGINGNFIKFDYPISIIESDDPMDEMRSQSVDVADEWDSIKYHIDPTLDPSLKHLVEKILPLATYYMSIEAFVDQYSRFEYGTINHALCSAIREFIKKYLTFIAQIEHEFNTSSTFTLQRLWFHAQDILQSMKILHGLVTAIRQIKTKKKESIEEEDEDIIESVIEGLNQDEANGEAIIPEQQKGGAILNILSDRLIGLGGDPNCKKIYTFLLSKASKPYFEILNSWIYHGEIIDPYNEFMVLEKRNVKKENLKEDFNDAYWEMRYTIRDGVVPKFLEPMQNQILLAGKFLNVVRECGVSIGNPEEMQSEMLGQDIGQDLRLDSPVGSPVPRNQEPFINNSNGYQPARSEVWTAVNGSSFVKNLEVAYKYANHTLLNLLMQDQQLLQRLRSLKHYFFLDQSDFLTSFLDLAKDELKQPARQIQQARLQSLMDLVLRNPSSVAAYDPFKEDVKVSMSHLRLTDQLLRIINVAGMESLHKDPRLGDSSIFDRNQMTQSTYSLTSTSGRDSLSGYEALVLDYTVTFPLSLVISRKALTKYQLLFRQILNLKYVEDLLCNVWTFHKTSIWKKQSSHPVIENWKFRIFTLRSRMLTFVQQFAYYVTNEVLEPNWSKLESNLRHISTVDQVLQYHSDFLDTCLKECMLTNSKLLRIFNKLMGSCMSFASQTDRYNSLLGMLQNEQELGNFGIPKAGLEDTSSTFAIFESTNRSLDKIEETFLYHMKLLIDALNYYSAAETVQFLCLVVRLDYNQFYSQATVIKEKGSSASRQQR